MQIKLRSSLTAKIVLVVAAEVKVKVIAARATVAHEAALTAAVVVVVSVLTVSRAISTIERRTRHLEV